MATTDERKAKREAKETEFIDGIEQVLGFYLTSWQKEAAKYVRQQSLTGSPIDHDVIKQIRRDHGQ